MHFSCLEQVKAEVSEKAIISLTALSFLQAYTTLPVLINRHR